MCEPEQYHLIMSVMTATFCFMLLPLLREREREKKKCKILQPAAASALGLFYADRKKSTRK